MHAQCWLSWLVFTCSTYVQVFSLAWTFSLTASSIFRPRTFHFSAPTRFWQQHSAPPCGRWYYYSCPQHFAAKQQVIITSHQRPPCPMPCAWNVLFQKASIAARTFCTKKVDQNRDAKWYQSWPKSKIRVLNFHKIWLPHPKCRWQVWNCHIMARCRDCQARHWPRHVPEGVFLGRAWLGCPYVGPVLWPPRLLAFEGGESRTEYDNCPSSYEYDNTTLV